MLFTGLCHSYVLRPDCTTVKHYYRDSSPRNYSSVSFTHPHVVTNPQNILILVQSQKRCLCCSFLKNMSELRHLSAKNDTIITKHLKIQLIFWAESCNTCKEHFQVILHPKIKTFNNEIMFLFHKAHKHIVITCNAIRIHYIYW